MSDRDPQDFDDSIGPGRRPDALEPLPGEAGIPSVAARRRGTVSKKALLALALLVVSLGAVSVVWVQRFFAGTHRPDDEVRRNSDRPAAASIEPRRLDFAMPRAGSGPTAGSAPPRVPALVPTAEELAEPIGVRRSGASASGAPKAVAPEDAPVMVVSGRPGGLIAPLPVPDRREDLAATGASQPTDPLSATTRNLQGYQRQLQGVLDTLTRSLGQSSATSVGLAPGAPLGLPPGGGIPPGAMPPLGGGLFGGQLQGSGTPRVQASMLGNRSLTLPKGTAFTCALKTKVISAVSGLVGCQVQRNVYGDDGRVLLVERGSHLDGEYRIVSVRPGMVRIPVLWTRIRTPHGVTVDIESPGTGALGESGIDGFVDNRWPERIGAAMLLSLIDDSVKLVISAQASEHSSDTVVLQSTTSNTSRLAEKVLDSTINIPPLIYQNQGGIVGIYVARDVDFSSVYGLEPVEVAR